VGLLTDDLSVRLLTCERSDAGMFQPLPVDRGGAALAERLCEMVAEAPSSPLTRERARLAAQHVDVAAFDAWWQPQLRQAARTPLELDWLIIGAEHQAGSRLPAEDQAVLALATARACAAAINAGVAPPPESSTERRLVEAALAGECSDCAPNSPGYAQDLVRALAPRNFLLRAQPQQTRAYQLATGHTDDPRGGDRSEVFRRLKQRDPRFARVQEAAKFTKGQSATTSPWGNTAREVSRIFGRCWLASELAVIGAAIPPQRWRTGGDLDPNRPPFGEDADYGVLLRDVRANRDNPTWWRTQHRSHDDPLSQATWALALTAVASPGVVQQNLPLLDSALAALPERLANALAAGSSRIGATKLARVLPYELVETAARAGADLMVLLLAHHLLRGTEFVDLPCLDDERVKSIVGTFGVAAWPATHAISARVHLASPASLMKFLEAAGAHGDVHVPDEIPPEVCDQALKRPAAYPRCWVEQAERAFSAGHSESPLVEEARAWLPEDLA
jgi:hypothetical protein